MYIYIRYTLKVISISFVISDSSLQAIDTT